MYRNLVVREEGHFVKAVIDLEPPFSRRRLFSSAEAGPAMALKLAPVTCDSMFQLPEASIGCDLLMGPRSLR